MENNYFCSSCFTCILMPHNMIVLHFRFLAYFHISNNALLSTWYFSTLMSHRRCLDTFYQSVECFWVGYRIVDTEWWTLLSLSCAICCAVVIVHCVNKMIYIYVYKEWYLHLQLTTRAMLRNYICSPDALMWILILTACPNLVIRFAKLPWQLNIVMILVYW